MMKETLSANAVAQYQNPSLSHETEKICSWVPWGPYDYFLPLLSLCCSHALGDTYGRSFCDGLLSLFSPLFWDTPGDSSRYLRRSSETGRMRGGLLHRWAMPVIFAADVVDLTSYPFSLVLRWWVWKTEGFIWAPVVTRLQWLRIGVMPSGKDRQGVTSSGLRLGRTWGLSLGLTDLALAGQEESTVPSHTRTHSMNSLIILGVGIYWTALGKSIHSNTKQIELTLIISYTF
jgi:hypothetical protein